MTTRRDANVPIRTCIGCRARRPQTEMHRCVVDAAGTARVDRRASGRGAYLCGPQCLDAAVRRRAFERAWRRPVPPGAIDALRADLNDQVRSGGARQDDPSRTAGGDRPHPCETRTTTKG